MRYICQTEKYQAKSGDGLSDSKPRWKYYAIMSFLDVTLMRMRYAANVSRIYIHTFKHIISVMKQFVKNHKKS